MYCKKLFVILLITLMLGACGGGDFEETIEAERYEDKSSGVSQCPQGCKTHVTGCDIKGDISAKTSEEEGVPAPFRVLEKEKIYHLPGQKYYDETSINPEDGERWFCTEKEAKANGWRKAEQ